MKISIGALIAIGTTLVGAIIWIIAQCISYLTLQTKVADDDAWLRDTRAWVYVANFPTDPWSVAWKNSHRWVDKP